jgi:hypothetical protein
MQATLAYCPNYPITNYSVVLEELLTRVRNFTSVDYYGVVEVEWTLEENTHYGFAVLVSNTVGVSNTTPRFIREYN